MSLLSRIRKGERQQRRKGRKDGGGGGTEDDRMGRGEGGGTGGGEEEKQRRKANSEVIPGCHGDPASPRACTWGHTQVEIQSTGAIPALFCL